MAISIHRIIHLFLFFSPHESTKQRRTASVGNMSEFIITSILTCVFAWLRRESAWEVKISCMDDVNRHGRKQIIITSSKLARVSTTILKDSFVRILTYCTFLRKKCDDHQVFQLLLLTSIVRIRHSEDQLVILMTKRKVSNRRLWNEMWQ